MRPQGVSLLEFLLVIALTAIIGGTWVALANNSNQIHQGQQELSDLEQNTAVLVHMLQTDLRLAGYRGGEAADFSGNWSAVNQAQALRWLSRSENWLNFRYNNLPIPTLDGSFRDGSLSYLPTDELELNRVLQVSQPSSSRVCLERLRYDLNQSDLSLRRSRTLLLSSAQDLSTNLTANLAFSLNNCAGTSPGGSSTPQPIAEGVEDFQVFFMGKDGWSAAVPASSDLRAIGVYLRTRSANTKGTSDCGAWPKAGVLPAAAEDLGVLSRTYSGNNCKYRRLERVLTISLSNPQAYSL